MERRNDPRKLWSSINTLLDQNPTSATTDFSDNDFVTFLGQKTPDVRKESQGAKPPSCAPLHSSNFVDFAQLTVDNVKNRIIDKPAKQSDHVPGTTWLINDCANDISHTLWDYSISHWPAIAHLHFHFNFHWLTRQWNHCSVKPSGKAEYSVGEMSS